MSRSKEIVLNRIREALGKQEAQKDWKPRRDYHHKSGLSKEELLDQFSERVSEYRAVTEIISENELGKRLGDLCRESGIGTLVLPGGINEKWINGLNKNTRCVFDHPVPLSKQALNNSDAVLTSSFLGVAQTGTIVLTAGPGEGRRALTLLPDFHICVVKEEQIVGTIPEAFRKLDPVVKETGRPVTFISGPSATSDIELNRVEGVHGPRKLHVFIVRQAL